MINTRKTKGVSVEGNDIILYPARMLPRPKMRGHITAVSVQGDEIGLENGTRGRRFREG